MCCSHFGPDFYKVLESFSCSKMRLHSLGSLFWVRGKGGTIGGSREWVRWSRAVCNSSSVTWSPPASKGHHLQGDTRSSGPGEARRARFQGGLMCYAALKCIQTSAHLSKLFPAVANSVSRGIYSNAAVLPDSFPCSARNACVPPRAFLWSEELWGTNAVPYTLTLPLHLAVGWRAQSKPSSSEKDSKDESKKDGLLFLVQLSNLVASVAF